MRLVPFPESLTAFDQDAGIDTPLTYAITSGNEDGYFSIDTATGLIYQVRKFDKSN
jgi:hypothetical protein